MSLVDIFNIMVATAYGFITLITWVAIQAIKQTNIINNHWLPLVSILLGTVIGFIASAYIYGTDIYLGTAFGFLSGFSATGLNEVLNHYAFSPDNIKEK